MKTKPSPTLDSSRAAAQPYLVILGCGEAFDSELGNNACLLVGASRSAPVVLFDCGYQTPQSFWKQPVEVYSKLSHIVLTHLHADHAFGLVPLLMRFKEERRKHALVIAGPPGTEAWLKKALQLGYPTLAPSSVSAPSAFKKNLGFEVEFITIRDGTSCSLAPGLLLHAARTRHSVYNLSYRVQASTFSPFAISGDGTLTPAHLKLYSPCHLVLQETYTALKSLDGHTSLKEVLKVAQRLQAASHSLGPVFGITHCARGERKKIESALKKLNDSQFLLLTPGLKIHLAKPTHLRTHYVSKKP